MSLRNRPYYLTPLGIKPKYSKAEKQIIAWSLEWEGCISLSFNGIGIIPVVVIANTSPNRLEKFKEIIQFGKVRKTTNATTKRKSLFQWRTYRPLECLYVLKAILPFLVDKQEQAKTVIEFIENRIKRGAKEERIPFNEYEFSLVDKIRILNKKGVS
jgi:hypothetical protein